MTRALLSPIHSIIWRLAMRLSPQRRISGFGVWDLSDDGNHERRFESVNSALQLIARHDARRGRRIQADVARILIADQQSTEYWPGLHACVLAKSMVDRGDVIRVALALVHEGTHAGLWNYGFRYPAELRRRLEQICLREEHAFAAKVPDTYPIVLRAVEDRLSRPWWTDRQIRTRKLHDLERAGTPKWITRTLRRIYRIPAAPTEQFERE